MLVLLYQLLTLLTLTLLNAVNTANSASSAASSAVSTANTASSNASAAVSTANTASSNATSAVNTANSALSTANAAASAVANAILYDIVANVAAIPGSPANNDAVEVTDSTGIESFTPLTGIPGGFAGNSGLSVRIVYTTTGNTWTWIQYFPNDPETRYLKEAGDTMTGALGVTTGTAAAPSVFISGDPNTGIYSPGADQVAVATNGTQRLAIDANGNVSLSGPNLSIGGTAPANAGYSNLYANNTSGAQLFLSVNGANSRVVYSTATDLNYYISDASPHIWHTNNAERMRLDSSGRLGIGTSSPSAQLHLSQSGTSSYTTLKFSNTGASGRTYEIGVGGSTSASGYAGNLYVYDSTATATRVVLDSSGRVGIGTTSTGSYNSAADNLVVADSGNGGITIATGTSNYGSIYFADGTSGADQYRGVLEYNHSNNAMAFFTDGSERFRCDSSGRLLVGTSSAPTSGQGQYSKLVVQGNSSGSGAGYFAIQRTSASTLIDDVEGVLSFNDNSGNTFAQIICATDATPGTGDYPGRLVFSVTRDGQASPTEALRIENTGRSLFRAANAVTYIESATTAGTTDALITGAYSSGTISLRVWTNGNIQNTNNSYTALSDIKLKENVVDAKSQWDDIKALQVRNYNLKEGQTHKQIGLIAQEVEPISPGLVYESPDRDAEGNDLGTVTKSVNYSVLYMKAVKALQEAMERIEQLEQRRSH
jgi:hypothetical protein